MKRTCTSAYKVARFYLYDLCDTEKTSLVACFRPSATTLYLLSTISFDLLKIDPYRTVVNDVSNK